MEEAIKLIDRKIILNYRKYPYKRFESEARVVQCFNCGKWGHKAKFCTNKAMCMLCGGDAHLTAANVREYEAGCPVNTRVGIPKRYLNCNGAYVAFSVNCCMAKEQKQRAKERYLNRLITFAPSPVRARNAGNVIDLIKSPTNTETTVADLATVAKRVCILSSEDRIGGRKKGRPSNLQKVAKLNNNILAKWAATPAATSMNATPMRSAHEEYFNPLPSSVPIGG